MENTINRREVKREFNKINKKIEATKIELENERRRSEKNFERQIKEIKVLLLGNKKDIQELYRRSTDNTDEIEKLQNIVSWTFKTIVGIVITVLLTSILNIFFGFFK